MAKNGWRIQSGKLTEGVYVQVELEANQVKTADVERQTQLGTDVLRFLLTVKRIIMASRSLNKVMLIGNLTRDPNYGIPRRVPQYVPSDLQRTGIGRRKQGEKKEDVEFHRVVAWNKLAELCSQLLVKGRKIYVEGRLHTNSWKATDGSQRSTTEVVIEDMIILDSRLSAQAGRPGVAGEGAGGEGSGATTTFAQPAPSGKSRRNKTIMRKAGVIRSYRNGKSG